MSIYAVTGPQRTPGSETSKTVRVRRCLVDGRAETVLGQMRAGSRPSLVGTIPGLNQKMETAFRSGAYSIVDTGSLISPAKSHLGRTSLRQDVSWLDFGLPEHPSPSLKRAAAGTYDQWRQMEIFSPDGEREEAARSQAESAFGTEFHFELLHAGTAEEVGHVSQLMRLFASEVLDNRLIRSIDLNYRKTELQLYKYESATKTLLLANPEYRWDAYLYTKIFLTGIGFAAFYTLAANERADFDTLHRQCEAAGVYLASDPTGLGSGEHLAFPRLWDFFAGNFAQFHLLGQGMIDRSQGWELRSKLREFYAKNFSQASRIE